MINILQLLNSFRDSQRRHFKELHANNLTDRLIIRAHQRKIEEYICNNMTLIPADNTGNFYVVHMGMAPIMLRNKKKHRVPIVTQT